MMFPSTEGVRKLLAMVIADKAEQGHITDGLDEELVALPNSLDALIEFGSRLADLPMRDDWPYVEPEGLEEIWAECAPDRPSSIDDVDLDEAARTVEAAFIARVCGCMLGKPFEIEASLAEIEATLEPLGEWPLADYPSERAVLSLKAQQGQWRELVRERIDHVAPDDDINYTILAMLALEQSGAGFTQEDLRRLWLLNLPVAATFGPERTFLLRSGLEMLTETGTDLGPRPSWINPGEELCGALIRADAYGYASPGRPALAAELAHRDATLTHRRSGVYGSMFVAAAISAAFVVKDPIEVFTTAQQFIPRRSRLHEAISDCIVEIRTASNWLGAYRSIHKKYERFGFCRIVQELGTVMNSVRFAGSVGDGICIQVSQGNDTDSFGATAGSILGVLLGPGHLEPRWVEPFRDDIHTALALFQERSLSALARRMGELPDRILGQQVGLERRRG
jgi:hypothetical protein